MGIREKLNENPRLTTGMTVGLLAVALLVLVWNLWPSRGGTTSGATLREQVYYTDDDGATYFPPDMDTRVAPFTYTSGRTAVRAHVFQCGRRSTPFSGYLEKYDDTAKQALEEFYKNPKNAGKTHPNASEFDSKNVLVKAPGGQRWYHITKDSAQAANVMRNIKKCPDGSPAVEFKPRVLN